MRPLARWTIGMTNHLGEETLRHSIRRFRTLYPEFDLVVCCNNLKDNQKERLKFLNVNIHEQHEHELDYPLTPVTEPSGWKCSMPGWGWKLVPPRLRFDSHELWIDNDIIIRKRLPSIDKWLKTDRSIISKGSKRCYGIYDDDIPHDTNYCAGLFGVPPYFDFSECILRHCKKLNGNTLGYYDEQGVTVLSVLEKDPFVLSLHELSIVKNLVKPYPRGLHFTGVNRTEDHKLWNDYKCYLLM